MRRKRRTAFIFLFTVLMPVLSAGEIFANLSFERLCESEIYRRVNLERSRQSPALPRLQRDSGLDRTALLHAADMVHRKYVDHVSPEGITPHERITRAHRSLLITETGENLWMHQWDGAVESAEATAARMMSDWMHSPHHRKNILGKRFTHIGIHVLQINDRIYAVQHFAESRGRMDPSLPMHLQRGGTLMLTIKTEDPDLANPRKFDLVDPETFDPVCDPTYLRTGHLDAPSGEFLIRLYFLGPGEKRWEIYTGPLITVL